MSNSKQIQKGKKTKNHWINTFQNTIIKEEKNPTTVIQKNYYRGKKNIPIYFIHCHLVEWIIYERE